MMADIDTLTRKMKAQGLCDCPPKVAAHCNKLFEVIEYHGQVHGAGKIDTSFLQDLSIVPLYGNQVQLLCVKLTNGSVARADLTVSLVLYSVRNGVTHGKFIQLGFSCRMKNGKITILRQFDFDILGDAETMIPEAECFRIISEVCGDLKLSKRGKVWFRVNHCGLLLSILEICGVKDKVTQEEVWKILGQAEKNADYKMLMDALATTKLDQESAATLVEYVKLKGGNKLLQKLRGDMVLAKSHGAKESIEHLECFLKYCTAFSVTLEVRFELDFVGVFDYYSGLIFEAVYDYNGESKTIACGGRYDKLGTRVKETYKTPFVGFTFCTEILLEVCNFEEINFDILGEMAYLPPHEFEEMMSCASEDQVHLEVSAVEESNADQSSQLMIGQFSTLPQKPGRNNLLGHQVPTSLSSAEKGQIGELVIGQFLQKPGSIQPHQLQSSERNELVATSSLNLTPCKCTYLLDWWNTIHVIRLKRGWLLEPLNHKNLLIWLPVHKGCEEIPFSIHLNMSGYLLAFIRNFGGVLDFVYRSREQKYNKGCLADREELLRWIISGVSRNVLEGLVYLHEQGIVHGNISASNILLKKPESCTHTSIFTCDCIPHWEVKVTDFDSINNPSQLVQRAASRPTHWRGGGGGKFFVISATGTSGYRAPEIFEEFTTSDLHDPEYFSPASDIWALGSVGIHVVMGFCTPRKQYQFGLMMLAHRGMLKGEERDDIISRTLGLHHIREGFPGEKWKDMINFVSRPLQVEQADRPSAADLLKDPFISRYKTATYSKQ